MDQYRQFIHISRYARFLPEEERRETWDETVDRYIDFFKQRNPKKKIPWQELRDAIHNHDVMPSMRALMTAGKALDRDNVAGYNCAYVAVDHQRVFDEILYILMCGTGVGFSVERQFINKLPEVPHEIHPSDTTIVVSDSKIGWASAYRQLIAMLYSGDLPKWDLSRVRPAGTRLKTFGGRSSGPDPLDDLFRFTVSKFIPGVNNGSPTEGLGRKLNSLECHDLICKVADIVVCGGVRRSALLSLSNLTDERMQRAKVGNFWDLEPQRQLANISTSYTERPDVGIFMREWATLHESGTGERGIFNRNAAKKLSPERRDLDYEFGTNPCSEIVLRSKQFCNLTEVVLRNNDTFETINKKIELATILGTLQATLTDFRYLTSTWKHNTEEERLLGVSLTGIMDHKTLSQSSVQSKTWLPKMRTTAVETNKKYAAMLGIEQSAAITCVKPSGTVSQLTNSASGIHPRYSEYYIRTVRQDKKDPLADWMIERGFPAEEDLFNNQNWVFSFPQQGPHDAVFRNDKTAIEQLEHWKMFAQDWCEHKPSITVYIRDHEWMEVGAWVYTNFDILSGVSFLPYSGGIYKQAPYQEIDETVFKELSEKMPHDISFTDYKEFEDNTVGMRELACVAGVCEI